MAPYGGRRRDSTARIAPPPSRPGRVAFLGTPDTSVVALRALADAGFEVTTVVTREDARRSRRGPPEPSPVKQAAAELGLAVSHRVDDVLGSGAELGVVVAYGRLIRSHVLAELPMVNLHFSLLPRWRGAAPVERCLLAGDTRTGVDLMAVEEELDTGGIYARTEVEIGPDETADELRDRLARLGATLLVDTLRAGIETPTPQQGDATYAEKLTAEDLRLHWAEPAEALHRVVRVGGAWAVLGGDRLKVHRAVPTAEVPGGPPGSLHPGPVVACGRGALELLEVQPAGRPRMAAADWWRGARPGPGAAFDQ
jgi:methionyl-tRNA formyltransferase